MYMTARYAEWNNKWGVVNTRREEVFRATMNNDPVKLKAAKAALAKAIKEVNAVYPNTKGYEHLHFDKYGKKGQVV